ncbi:MAG: diacylglycerol kinase family protein [Solirubrobacterales bacterium]
MRPAVVAHAGKQLGGGLPELRRLLAEQGFEDPLWFEVPKAKRAPAAVEAAIEAGADLILAWGGDGMVRRCVNALADTQIPLGILPAGTANLLANHLGIEADLGGALRTALRGERRRLDVGRFEGERFAVMAGAGLDAAMIRGADELKDRLGRVAYVFSGAANLTSESFEARIEVDGTLWYEGPASCVLVGNIGELFGGIEVFADAAPDDGLLDLGLLTAEGPLQIARAAARTVAGDTHKSPFVRVTKARKVRVELDRKVRYELDGGDRKKVKSFKVKVEPGAITVCVPAAGGGKGKR